MVRDKPVPQSRALMETGRDNLNDSSIFYRSPSVHRSNPIGNYGMKDTPDTYDSGTQSSSDYKNIPLTQTTAEIFSNVGHKRAGGKPKFGTKKMNKVAEASKKIAKKHRYRPGTRALMEIRKFQKTVNMLIPKAPFCRLIREIIQMLNPTRDMRIQSEAINALQEASEAFLVTMFEAGHRCAIHAKRVTVMPSDFSLIRWILSLFNAGI
ncbi:core histone h2A/H2B/H3/H4 domain-containing protein [Ditylenchus destructor]|uniref:Core histone h2A/H2B/H3/H4 domain-containing protein n=1 Tax=Ditylenchus destructor TaxID=166010 RepID=A0AAD4MXF2_9BILA|nr:core histone h2A/H2B/H3/H4 domain-containing protein [Ditylenchus destructor]